MQIDTNKIIKVSSDYPLLTGVFVVAFLGLTIGGIEYPFSTLLLLVVTGLAFFFGGRITRPPEERKVEEHGTSEPIEDVKASIAAAVEAVVESASELVESVAEEMDLGGKPKARAVRRRSPRAKPAA